jgi:hypothetical protein
MLWAATLAAIAILGWADPSRAAGKEEGIAAFLQGDYGSALDVLEPVAREGDFEAQFLVGEMLLKGLGTKQDIGGAFDWYKKAAEAGHAQAQANLGSLMALGLVGERNMPAAYYWWILSAVWTRTELQGDGFSALSEVASILTQEEKRALALEAKQVWR